jgi:mycothiol synthase
MQITIRPFEEADLPGLVELVNRCREADGLGVRLTTEEVLHTLNFPNFDINKDCFVAVAPDGRLVGDIHVTMFEAGSGQGASGGRVHPDYRRQGIGTRLIRTIEARLLERAKTEVHPDKPITMRRVTPDSNTGAMALFEAEGHKPVRNFYKMHITFAGPAERSTFSGNVTLRPFDPERDARAVYDTFVESFSEHWGNVTVPFEGWSEHFLGHPHFDPSLWLVAYDGDQVAGACINVQSERPNTGYIDMLGVRKPWRKRGIGSALLSHSLHLFQDRGFAGAELIVDAGNETNALALYQRAGMEIARRDVVYRKVLRGNEADLDPRT